MSALIGAMSIALGLYQLAALVIRRPTVSRLSIHPIAGPFIWTWWAALGLHFLDEAITAAIGRRIEGLRW